jgi:hypothetical protein
LGNAIKDIKEIKIALANCYEMTDLGEIDSYLGVRITRDRSLKRLEIDQSRYISEIVDRFGMADANPARTPLPAGAEVHLIKYDGEATSREIKDYQKLIGSLLYVQIGTRPDILFAISRLAQYASNPSAQHMRLAKYVLAYLKGSVSRSGPVRSGFFAQIGATATATGCHRSTVGCNRNRTGDNWSTSVRLP